MLVATICSTWRSPAAWRFAVGGVVELAGEFAQKFAGGGLHGVVVAAQLDYDAGGLDGGRGVFGEGLGPGFVPAVGTEDVGVNVVGGHGTG
jgi:hypothetical protein